ncbi:MAG: translocation/assembly module TamB domain-containing protein [Candidatus Edwardsbacteria bacterium]|jgi:autotransporter translocation and assembly factor TamB|nr:translocation/assembly module TamB domain-containing protein [Candidatus Edwardsbacteria bacterium]
MRRRLRDLTPWLAMTLVVAMVATFAAVVGSDRFRAGLLARTNAVLSGALHREFAVGGVAYRFPLTVAISDLAVASHDSLSRGCMARIAQIRVSADPFRSLYRRRLTIGSINVSGARIGLEQSRDGRWNFSGPDRPDSAKHQGPTRFPPLALPSIVVGDLSLALRTPTMTETVEQVELQLGLTMGGDRLEAVIRRCSATVPGRGLTIKDISGRVTVRGDSIAVDRLRAVTEHSSVDVSAWLDAGDRRFAVTTCQAVLGLRDAAGFAGQPAAGWSGTVTLDATAAGPLATPQGLVAISATPCTAGGIAIEGLAARIRLASGAVQVDQLALSAGGGRVTATARLDYRQRAYDGELIVQHLDIGRIVAASRRVLSSDLNGTLAFAGSGFDRDRLAGRARMAMARSSVNDIPITSLDAAVRASGGVIEIERFRLESGQASLGISGDLYRNAVSIELETDEIELAQFGPLVGLNRLSGKLRLTGLLTGPLKNPDVIGSFRLKEAVLGDYACHYFDGDLSVKSITTRPIGDGKFSAREIYIGQHTINQIDILTELRGTEWGGVSIVIDKDSITSAQIIGRAEIDRKNINLIVSKLYYACGDQMIANSQPVRINIAGPTISLEPTELLLARGRLRLEGQYHGAKGFALKVAGRDIDSRRLLRLANLGQTVHGSIDLDLAASGTLADPRFTLAVEVADLRYEQFTADALALRADYADQTARVRRLTITRFGQDSEITAEVGVDLGVGPNLGKLLDKPIAAEVVLRDIGTWVFFPMADLLSVYEGRVDVNVRASGTPSRPLLAGNLTINQAKMVLRPLGMYLHNVQAMAHFNADSVVVDNITGMTEGQGTVQLGGYLLLEKFIPGRMRFDVATVRSPIRNIPFIEANVNSQITIGGSMDYVRIGGAAQVNSALITLPFAPAEEPPPPEGAQKPMDLDLSITGPNGIWLRNKDADIELKIDNLNVRMSQNILFLSGQLEPLQGVYRFLDRSFDITEGTLTFTNAAVINPSLNLKAHTTVFASSGGGGEAQQKYEIYLTVGGTALQPKLTFSSDPSRSEQEILTLVGAGMMLDESGSGDLSLTGTALRGVDYALGIAAGKIQKGTGLDLLKIKTQAGAESKPQVTLGKYITRDVFVSYSQGFSSNLSTEFKAEYLFGGRSAVFAQKSEAGKYNLGLRMKFKY